MKVPTQGLVLNNFSLDQKIGEGSFGEVWRAHNVELPTRHAAIKFPVDSTALEVLEREGKLLSSLNHKYIVRIEDMSLGHELPHIRMELVEGVPVSFLISTGPVSPVFSLAVVGQVLAALDYAHGKGVLHRDISPGNILVGENGIVKLTDFGLAKETNQSSDIQVSGMYRSTNPGIIGTLAYMSPEQKMGKTLQPSSDVYSVGVILYQLLTGSLPTGLRLPSFFVPLPKEVDDLVVAMLDTNDHRIKTAKEALWSVKELHYRLKHN